MNNLFVLTVTHGVAGTQESFFFKTREAADDAHTALYENDLEFIKDDFGSAGFICVDQIGSSRVSDMEKSLEVQSAQALLNAKAQMKAQRAAQNDPALKLVAGLQPPMDFRQ